MEKNESLEKSKGIATKHVPLFGGAIQCAMPENFMDASTIKTIPDNQEVWLGTDPADGCVIIELLDYQADVDNEHAIAYFFEDLAQDNDVPQGESSLKLERIVLKASSSDTPQILSADDCLLEELLREDRARKESDSTGDGSREGIDVVVCSGIGYQRVPSGRKHTLLPVEEKQQEEEIEESGWVQIEMGLIRLKKVQTDLLITLTVPRKGSPKQYDAALSSGGETHKSASSSSQVALSPERHSEVFEQIMNTVKIVDWSLFG